MFLNFRHNAITSDLYTNYQYFEVNIDKATKTLPEYVDYEVLFDKNEIKRGIPILYTYLQKRAEDEQRELELARLKNVEHEKFNFDESGIAASLVLERAMQEAENYIAERKKYNQDTEQINNDITQEEMNYREITKEYNRQMQVSRETFANFKSQLEDASSSIEANYIKKQQQQELDRQRNLERDFDTATERHKKIIESYQAELDSVDKFRLQSRKVLEDAMMSEFETYSSKVYDEAKKLVEEREQEKYNEIKAQIRDLEEKIVSKDQELEEAYSKNQSLVEQLEEVNENLAMVSKKSKNKKELEKQPEPVELPVKEVQNVEIPKVTPTFEPEEVKEEPVVETETVEEPVIESEVAEEAVETVEFPNEESVENQEYGEAQNFGSEEQYEDYEDYDSTEQFEQFDENQDYENYDEFDSTQPVEDTEQWEEFEDYQDWEDYEEPVAETDQESEEDDEQNGEGEPLEYGFDYSEWEDFEEPTVETVEEEVEEDNKNISTNQNESEMSGVAKRKAGRPRKVVSEEDIKPKRGRGRPKKELTDAKPLVKKGRGRPKKVESKEETKTVVKAGRGRPRKEVTEAKPVVKKGRGRPKKAETKAVEKAIVKAGRGRPRKETTEAKPLVKKGRGRPKKVEAKTQSKAVVKCGRGRPKKVVTSEQFKNIEDIDAYLKEIDSVIAQENAKFEASKKALEKKANLKNKK